MWWDGRVTRLPGSTLTSRDGELTAWMEVYTRSLFIAAAGTQQLGTAEPKPDVKGIDLMVDYPQAAIGVQLKSTYSLGFNQRGKLEFKVKPKWVANWHGRDIPPRLVLYVLEKDPTVWCRVRGLGEFHRVHAYWALLDRGVSAPSVTIDRRNRFTPHTLLAWGRELEQGMGGRP